MKISENIKGLEWLRQFDVRDVYAARMLLDSLKLVSFAECELTICGALERICGQTTGKLALFTADKKLINPTATAPGSEDRLGHLLTNVQRQFDDRVLVRPTLDEMRAAKVDHVIIVDDFIGSGQRIDDFWDVWTSTKTELPVYKIRKNGKRYLVTRKRGKLRSWLSFGYCKLWLVGYAIHETGLERLVKGIPYLKQERVLFGLVLKEDANYWPEEVDEFLDRTDKLRGESSHNLGWGNLRVPLVFQHGCPDNCPKILWKNGDSFRAIFPNRAVPTALYDCFDGQNDCQRGPSLLMAAGQSRLALALIKELSHTVGNSKYADILTILGLILSGYAIRNLSRVLMREESEIQNLLNTAHEMGLLDAEFKITIFGRDVVDRSRKTFLTNLSAPLGGAATVSCYVPTQFQKRICGVR